MNLLRAVIGLAFLLVPQTASALPQSKPQLPNPMGYVSDHAGVITPSWKERIRSVCQDLERKTGVDLFWSKRDACQPITLSPHRVPRGRSASQPGSYPVAVM